MGLLQLAAMTSLCLAGCEVDIPTNPASYACQTGTCADDVWGEDAGADKDADTAQDVVACKDVGGNEDVGVDQDVGADQEVADGKDVSAVDSSAGDVDANDDAATGCKDDKDCDDGDNCTLGDKCGAQGCESGKKVNCDDGKMCTTDSCDPAGECLHKDSAATCDDGDACTVGEACAIGLCAGGVTKTCDDGNGCTADSCAPGSGCIFQKIGGGCSDGDSCTDRDTCVQGVCKGTPIIGIACCAAVGGKAEGAHCMWTNKEGRKMTLIPPGPFWMGCNEAKDSKCGGDAICQAGMRTFPWGETPATCTHAVILDNSGPGCGKASTSPVGQKVAGVGPYGAYDMAGSVLEWVRDGYSATWYSAHGPQSWPDNPWQSSDITNRSLLGGSWATPGGTVRSSSRMFFQPTSIFAYVGFRCSRAIP
jgi:hypothetical protein